MMGFVIAVHVAACVLLILIILIQAGRGGGLVEGFSGVESVFGTKTNVFLTRATSIFSILFFLTCIMLALLSARQSRSLMRDTQAATATAVPTPAAPETPKTP
jgi:preprotein translocase subunit SecG